MIRLLADLLSRWQAYWQMRAIELQLEANDKLAEDPLTAIEQINIAHRDDWLRQQLARSRANYLAHFPPGVRRTWEIA